MQLGQILWAVAFSWVNLQSVIFIKDNIISHIRSGLVLNVTSHGTRFADRGKMEASFANEFLLLRKSF